MVKLGQWELIPHLRPSLQAVEDLVVVLLPPLTVVQAGLAVELVVLERQAEELGLLYRGKTEEVRLLTVELVVAEVPL